MRCRTHAIWLEMLQDALEVQDLDKHAEDVRVSHFRFLFHCFLIDLPVCCSANTGW
jgi:hypothetical protein